MLSRETWAEISCGNILSNYNSVKKEINNQEICPVLKANAYGHGLKEVGRLFMDLDLPFLCVASLDEAYQLIDAGVTQDILVFSYVDPAFVLHNNRSQILFTIPSLEWYKKVKGQARFHLEINSGMNRMGLSSLKDVERVLELSHGKIEGIYTHFASNVYDEKSKADAKVFTDIFEALNYKFKYVHAGNISTRLFNELKVFDAMRMGLGLFGYHKDITLKPAMEVYSNVIYRTDIQSSDTVGYDYNYKVNKDAYSATIPIGYADGFDKRQKKLKVWVNNKSYSIIGGICMDQSMILVDGSISLGDKVELLGQRRTMDDIVNTFETSEYEILVGFGPRITRVYID